MITNPRFDTGRFRAPADDAVGVLLEKGIGGKLAGLAAGAAEEIAVDVIGDAGRFDVVVQILIEAMMAGKVVLLAAFGAEPKDGSSTVLKVDSAFTFTTGSIRLQVQASVTSRASCRLSWAKLYSSSLLMN
jgi:hypothetical protein